MFLLFYECYGSTHCDIYREEVKEPKTSVVSKLKKKVKTNNNNTVVKCKKKSKKKKKKASNNVGIDLENSNIIQYVDIDKIEVSKDSKEYNVHEHILDNVKDYYKKNYKISMPVYVTYKDGKLVLKGNYNIYELAKKFRIKEIPVEIVSEEQFQERAMLRTIGVEVFDNKTGDVGNVVKSIKNEVYIDFDGEVKRYNIYKFLELDRWEILQEVY